MRGSGGRGEINIVDNVDNLFNLLKVSRILKKGTPGPYRLTIGLRHSHQDLLTINSMLSL